MNREQLIQSIVARKMANQELNKVLCFAQKVLCFAPAGMANRAQAKTAR